MDVSPTNPLYTGLSIQKTGLGDGEMLRNEKKRCQVQ